MPHTVYLTCCNILCRDICEDEKSVAERRDPPESTAIWRWPRHPRCGNSIPRTKRTHASKIYVISTAR